MHGLRSAWKVARNAAPLRHVCGACTGHIRLRDEVSAMHTRLSETNSSLVCAGADTALIATALAASAAISCACDWRCTPAGSSGLAPCDAGYTRPFY